MHYGKDSRLQDQKNMIVDSFSSVGTFFPVLVSIAPVFCSEAPLTPYRTYFLARR